MTASAARPSRKIALSLSHDHSHGPLSYLEMGRSDAPCVLFIHGFGADLLTWQFCLVPLAADYRIVAIDLPGHGRTSTGVGDASLGFMTNWLDEAMDVLDIPQAHLVAHSMRGKIALGFALAWPERVRSLALISPAGLGGEFHHDTLDAFLHNPSHGQALAAQLLGPRGAHLTPSLARSLSEAAQGGRAASLDALLGQARAYGLALSPEGFDWTRVRAPIAILWGDHDRLIPMPATHRLPPDAPVHVVEGAGHLPHMEASGDVVSVIREFLQSCPL